MISASSDQTEADIIQLLRQQFESLPEVRSVLLTNKMTAWGVLVLVTTNDALARGRVYDAAEHLRSLVKQDVEIGIILATASPVPSTSSEWLLAFDKHQLM